MVADNSNSEAAIEYKLSPPVSDAQLNALFAAAWTKHTASDFQPILQHSLAYVCAYREEALVGFVNLAWDGGIHAFLLDTTVHPTLQRQGLGRELVARAVATARDRGIQWVHVDYEPHLCDFYRRCGFRPTAAGLIQLTP